MNQSTNEQRDAFMERIKKPGCPSIRTIAEEMYPSDKLHSEFVKILI